MRRKFNKIYSASGLVIFLIGLAYMFKAAGIADLGGDIDTIIRCSVAGVIVCGFGSVIHGWRV